MRYFSLSKIHYHSKLNYNRYLVLFDGVFFLFFFNFIIITLYREFSNERTRVERQAEYYKMRTKKKYIDTFNTYINWIRAAGIYRNLYARIILIIFLKV